MMTKSLRNILLNESGSLIVNTYGDAPHPPCPVLDLTGCEVYDEFGDILAVQSLD